MLAIAAVKIRRGWHIFQP